MRNARNGDCLAFLSKHLNAAAEIWNLKIIIEIQRILSVLLLYEYTVGDEQCDTNNLLSSGNKYGFSIKHGHPDA